MKAGISTTSGFDAATNHPSVRQGGKMKNIFRLYTKECRKVLCSLTFLLYTAAVFAMYYTQFHSELSGAETEPKPGLASYGITEREVPEILMPNALERLLWEYQANRYTAYPIGFYKEVHLMEKKRQKMADILCELTGWTHEELEHFGEEDDFKEGNNFEKDDAISFEIGSEDGIWQADDNNFVVGGGRNSVEKESSNLDDSVSENITVPEEFISENETAPQSSISGNEAAPESPISENETVPPSSIFEDITDSSTLLSGDITYTRFRELMREADELIGGGSRYSDQYIVYNFSQVPKTYEEALAEYRQLMDEDKITGGYARLYCDYIGLMLGILPVFVAVSLMQLDRKARMEQLVYSRRISSAKLIFTRYAALVTAMFLPIILTTAAAQKKIMDFYPGAGMDMFAFARYALLWLLPTLMVAAAAGMLLTELASGLLAILLQGAWWFVGMFSGGLTGDIGKFNLTIRHNSLYQLDVFREEYADFLFNRAFFVVLAILLVALTAVIYEEKRRGRNLGFAALGKHHKGQPAA